MANRKQRRRMSKPQGATYADVIAQEKYQQAVCSVAIHDHAVQVQSEIRTQRALWMCCIAMNRAFGIGPKRFLQFTEALDDVTAWYQEMLDNVDEVYAHEKLRRLASQYSGVPVAPLYDKEMTEMVEKMEQK